MILALLPVIATLIIALMATPVAKKIALRLKIYATTNERTVHNGSTPKLGGLSIFFAFTVGLIILTLFNKEVKILSALLVGGSIMLIVGLFDDLYNLSCYRKMAGQTLAAVAAAAFGFVVDTIYLPSGTTLHLGVWAAPLSIFWIVALTNAINLLDGLDGLASGFVIVVAFFVFAGALAFHNLAIAATALILIAASLGFLRYNFAPAKIFMGDMGSLFLGYTLACISLKAFTTPETGSHAAVLLVLFFVPLADTFIAILRRVSEGRHPFSADKKHIHHRLLDLGLSQTAAVLLIYAATFLCGAAALVLFVANARIALTLLAIILLVFFAVFAQLGCFDFMTRRQYSSAEPCPPVCTGRPETLGRRAIRFGKELG
jgi:UDP-GlcNAc:undecaprenyl-phosphate GlcNAc-1-phosphate transferase